MMRRLALVLSGWLLVLVTGVAPAAEAPRDALTHFFHQSFFDLKEEGQLARAEGKAGILIMFQEEDCPWCHKMKETVLNQPGVQDYYRTHFRLLHFDIKGDAAVVDFDGRETLQKDYAFKVHRVRATPVFLFLDPQGKVIHRHTGVTASPQEFLWLGEFVVSGAYQSTNFPVYKRGRAAAKP
jgi:thioredoxin-related protein